MIPKVLRIVPLIVALSGCGGGASYGGGPSGTLGTAPGGGSNATATPRAGSTSTPSGGIATSTPPSGGGSASPASAAPTSSPVPSTAASSPPSTTTAAPTTPQMVKVGTSGNEPLIAAAPDGTLYIAALANIYRSTDGGVTWALAPEPTIASTVLASDSSIAISPDGRLYYTFDYPYAGNTAVCTSDDRGNTWSCNPAVVPGGTDRMWVTAPGDDEAYETTNEGAYQTAFLESTDGGSMWSPEQMGDNVAVPSTGPLVKAPGTNVVLQVVDEHPGRYVYRYVVTPGALPQLASAVVTPVDSGEALPDGVLDSANNYYLVGEAPNPAGGQAIQIARSSDTGQTYTMLPLIPQTTSGTATFTAMAAGGAGHLVIVYYSTTDEGTDPPSMTSNWSAKVAETYDALDAMPSWTVTTLEPLVHNGGMCANAGCTGDTRYSGDFISAVIDPAGHVDLTWMDEPGTALTPTVEFARLH